MNLIAHLIKQQVPVSSSQWELFMATSERALFTQWNQLSKAKGGLSESQKRQLLGHFRSLFGR